MAKKSDLAKVFDVNAGSWKVVKRDEGLNKQLSTIEEILSKFGLLKNEIRVYLCLAQMGERKAGEIAEAISLHRTETYKTLRDLEKKGVVFSIFAKPLKFKALPLDKALDLLMDAQKSKIRLLEKEKTNLLKLWLSMPQLKIEKTKKELFQMLEGEQQVFLKAEQLLERTEKEFQIFAPDNHMAQLYYSDFTDKLRNKLSKISVTLLVENSPKSLYFMEQMNWLKENCSTVDASNHPDLPCFMISDQKELLIAFHDSDVTNETGDKKKFKTVALWTNYAAFISILQMLFLKLLSTDKT